MYLIKGLKSEVKNLELNTPTSHLHLGLRIVQNVFFSSIKTWFYVELFDKIYNFKNPYNFVHALQLFHLCKFPCTLK